MIWRALRSTLFPYTTLFRSRGRIFAARIAAGEQMLAVGLFARNQFVPVSHQIGIDHHNAPALVHRSEEHTSERQSRPHLVCRLLLEKKKDTYTTSKRYY